MMNEGANLNPTLNRKPLLQKYEIPIDHLSHEYVRTCTNIKELEKIIKILKSGEEGYYPDLEKCVEERLRMLSPNNRHLRTEAPALTRHSIRQEEWNNISADLAGWKNEVTLRDLRICKENNNAVNGDERLSVNLPPVRQLPPCRTAEDKKTDGVVSLREKPKRASDYPAWDKFDADAELLKMDLEEKQKGKPTRQQCREQDKEVVQTMVERTVKEAEWLSEPERQVLAEQENSKGNEYFNASEFAVALKHYSASTAIWPNAKAYNNRAACHLKMGKYETALQDADKCLEMEPNNVKALFRRATARQHTGRYREALDDVYKILEKEPNNMLCKNMANDLRDKVNKLPEETRLVQDDGPSKSKKIIEMFTANKMRDTSISSNCSENNKFNLGKAKFWCDEDPQCSRSRKPPAPKIVELSDETEAVKHPTRMNIIEVETADCQDNYRPRKSVVVDKRTQNTMCGGTFGGETKMVNSDFCQGPSTSSGYSGMVNKDFWQGPSTSSGYSGTGNKDFWKGPSTSSGYSGMFL